MVDTVRRRQAHIANIPKGICSPMFARHARERQRTMFADVRHVRHMKAKGWGFPTNIWSHVAAFSGGRSGGNSLLSRLPVLMPCRVQAGGRMRG